MAITRERPHDSRVAAQILFAQARVAQRAGRQLEAQHCYDEVIRLSPNHLDALHRLAAIALEAGHAARGAELIARTIELDPGVAQAHANLGYAFSLLRRFEEAEIQYGRAVVLQPDFADAHYSRGVMRDALHRPEEAVASYDEAIRLQPLYIAAHANRANALCDLERFEEALAGYNRAVALAPGDADIQFNRGNLLSQLGRHEDAVAAFDAALVLDCDNALAHNNLGIALNELGDHAAALSSFEDAIELKPDFAQAHVNRAVALADLKCHADALASYDRAIALNPAFAKAHYGRGVTLNELKRFEEALESYARAWTLAPDSPFLLGKLIHMKMAICDWRGFAQERGELAARVARGEPATPPFQTLPIADAPGLHRQVAEIYAAATHPAGPALPPIGKYSGHEKIRLGYFSADLHDHATAILMAELFERHDRARFELTAFSFGPDTEDPMRRRLQVAFDRFLDVRDRSDQEIALLARELEIDIAIDLKGYTGDERHEIFARRPAPIQVNYLGYPGTMGAKFMDYLIADATIVPSADRAHYCEKIVTLPHSYQPNDTARTAAEHTPSRAEAGLPDGAFVFCCFNNSYKITPDVFACWMRILDRTEGSVLWLLEDNPRAMINLCAEAEKHGIALARLIFAPRTNHPAHLARHRLADLFLDTLPYNAHTTASDALWMGLPVLTQYGASFAGRVAASLLKATGLPELITNTAAEYETAAMEFARDPGKLQAIRQRLASNRQATPLFDIGGFTRAIEDAYAAMHARHHAGLRPEHIEIS